MSEKKDLQYWEVWYPQAGATGVLIGRSQIEPADEVLFHSPPEVLTVEVSDGQGQRLAYGEGLKRTMDSPLCRLVREGDRIRREDFWPGEADLGKTVLLPGGEAGKLVSWQHTQDHSQWRWQLEFFNSKG